MRRLGYSKSYARSSHIKDTKSYKENYKNYQELLKAVIPLEERAHEHRVLLYDKEIMHYIFPKSYSDKQIVAIVKSFGFPVMQIKKQGSWKRAYFPVINAKAKKDALDMAYKIDKLYTNGTTLNQTINKYAGKSKEELEELVAGRIARLLDNGRRPARGAGE